MSGTESKAAETPRFKTLAARICGHLLLVFQNSAGLFDGKTASVGCEKELACLPGIDDGGTVARCGCRERLGRRTPVLCRSPDRDAHRRNDSRASGQRQSLLSFLEFHRG